MNDASRDLKIEGTALQIRKIGNSVGVILPKELLARLNAGRRVIRLEQSLREATARIG